MATPPDRQNRPTGAPGDERPQYLSTAQVSEALGVNVSTVKRWVDSGVLPAHKTAGGHRKLLVADVLRVVRRNRLPNVDLHRLGVDWQSVESDDCRVLSDRVLQGLLSADGEQVRALLHGAYSVGLPIDRIADEILAPAMARVGRCWETGAVDVFHEHRATLICTEALSALKLSMERHTDAGSAVAVGGAPEKDPYSLASLLIQMLLLDEGWRAVNLGPNTPLPSFGKAVLEYRPRLVWLSVGHLADAEGFLAEYAELYALAESVGAAVAVGGPALEEPIRKRMSYTIFGDRLAPLAEFARTLRSAPSVPKRGRPPGSGTGPADTDAGSSS